MTLLVLEIAVPASELSDLWHGIVHEWPSYLSYATSFLTIGGLWLVHHGVFRRLAFADNVVMRLNLLLLMVVAFLPFPTKLVAEAFHDQDAERAAVIFYGLFLLVITALINAMWRYIARHRELLEAEVTDREVNAILQATTPTAAFYVILIPLALIAPRVVALGYLLLAIIGIARAHGDVETHAATAKSSEPA